MNRRLFGGDEFHFYAARIGCFPYFKCAVSLQSDPKVKDKGHLQALLLKISMQRSFNTIGQFLWKYVKIVIVWLKQPSCL